MSREEFFEGILPSGRVYFWIPTEVENQESGARRKADGSCFSKLSPATSIHQGETLFYERFR
ncbi:hypothetical protein [Desulfatirhabdium butyrativorans]|uniref:hypothetical protein n=1 Tax=Desulfatirhabdium butyrativorans TaxID=340467 RepID=UPI0004121DB6|nr:hypothetical protein [Desulfatirhabdium butyrativorans]